MITSYDHLFCLLKEQLNEKEVFTFDVFDTILHRQVAPSLVLERLFKEIYDEISGKVSIQLIRQFRHEAYVQAAELNSNKGYDFEVNYNQFISLWAELIDSSQSESLSIFIAKIECEIEVNATYANDDIIKILKFLKSNNKKVLLISDMYLPLSTIEKIICGCGIDRDLYQCLYVSSEELFLKRTSSLFKVIAKKENIEYDKWMHFGDNSESDRDSATLLGIHGVLVRDYAIFKEFDAKEELAKKVITDPVLSGFHLDEYFGRKENTQRLLGYNDVGFRMLGPVLSAYCHNLLEKLKSTKTRKIYFCAREGAVIKSVCDELISRLYNDLDFQTEYLCVSRLSTFKASIRDGIRGHHISNCIANTGCYTINNIFKPFGFDKEILQKRAIFHGVGDINIPLPTDFTSWNPFINLIEDEILNELARSEGLEQCRMFTEYLSEKGFFNSESIALVDVGWSGQIQNNIYEALKHLESLPIIHGYYFGTRTKAHELETDKSKYHWIFANESHLGWFSVGTLQSVFVLETITRAPHPTVLGYTESEGVVSPVLKDSNDPSRRKEEQIDLVLYQVQTSAIEYSKCYSDLLKCAYIDPVDMLTYGRMCIDKLVRFPDDSIVSIFRKASNVSDLGSSEVNSLFDGHNRIKSIPSSLWPFGQASEIGRWVNWIYATRRACKHPFLTPRKSNPLLFNVWLKPSVMKSNTKATVENKMAQSNSINQSFWEEISGHLRVDLGGCRSVQRTNGLGREYLLTTISSYYITKIIRKIMRMHNYHNDAISLKKLLFTYVLKK